MKNENQIINVDFIGFYDSILSQEIDLVCEYMCEDNPEDLEKYYEDNYTRMERNACKSIVQNLNEILDTNIEFKDLAKPQAYNFENDQLVLEITKQDTNKIARYIIENFKEEYKERLQEVTTPRDGYIPFHDLKTLPETSKIAIMVETIIDNYSDCFDDTGFYNNDFWEIFNSNIHN